MVITIWDEVFYKLRVSFYGLVTSKEVFSGSSHRIEAHINVAVGVLDIQSSVSFEFVEPSSGNSFLCRFTKDNTRRTTIYD